MLLPNIVTSKLVQNSKGLLKVAHRMVPSRVQNLFVSHQLNHLSKQFMDDGELEFMNDKVVLIELRDLSANWYFIKNGTRLEMLNHIPEHADVTFSATVDSMVLMASQKVDPDTLFFNRELKITGDTELGLEIKNLIDCFDLSLLDKPFRAVLDVWSNTLLENTRREQHV